VGADFSGVVDYTKARCNRDEFWHRLNSDFLHHPLAVSFDRALCGSELMGDLLIDLSTNYKFKDLLLANSQSREASVEGLRFAIRRV
jgi:hypothetical protein